MLPSGFRQQKTYDRLQLPNERVERRKPAMSALDLELFRMRSGVTGQTQQLKYKFDFTRQPGARSGRLSAAPGIVNNPSMPNRGTGQGSVPAGVPGQRKNARRAHAGVQSAARGHASGSAPHAGSKVSPARPASGSVTDFRTVGPKPRGVRAPNLKDSIGALGIGQGPGNGAAQSGTKNRPKNAQQSSAQRPAMSTKKSHADAPAYRGWLSGLRVRKPAQIHDGNHQKASAPVRPPNPKTVRKWAELRGMGEDEATVIGFDISRSVFSGVPAEPQPEEEDPKVTSSQERRGRQKLKGTLLTIVFLVLVFMMLTASVASGARVSEVTRQNAELDRSNDALAEQVSKAEMQIALQDDLNKVRQRAEELGLKLPEEDQIEYVDLGDDIPRPLGGAAEGGQ